MVLHTTYTPTYEDVDYTPEGYTSHAGQVCNIYLPDQTVYPVPGSGYPTLIHVHLLGFTTSTAVTSITASSPSEAGVLHEALEAGWAVITATVTKANDATLAGNGKGFFHPPGAASGFYEDATKYMAVKDWIFLIQFVRYNATTYGFNPNAVAVNGNSAAGITAAWCLLGPERAGTLGTGGQHDMSTIPQCGILRSLTTDFLTHTNATTGVMFPDSTSGPTFETAATAQTDADTTYRTGLSIISFAPAEAYSRRVYLFSINTAYVGTSFYNPYTTNTEAIHSPYANFVWKAHAAKGRVRHVMVAGVTSPSDTSLFDRKMSGNSPPDLVSGDTEIIDWLNDNIMGDDLVDPQPLRGSAASPVGVFHKGEAAWSSGTVDTVGSLLFAYNPLRRLGVYVQNTGGTNDLKVGDATATANVLLDQRGATGGKNDHFIPGQGAVYGKSDTSTTTWAGYEF